MYNATSHEKLSLPYLQASKNCFSRVSLVYDASIDNYKVVLWVVRCWNPSHESSLKLESCYIYRLHSDNDENWRMLNIPFPQKILPYEAVAVGGVLYWTTTGFIQSMDISREEFMGRIEVPCKRDEAYFGLMEIKGSLSLMNRTSDNKLEIAVGLNSTSFLLHSRAHQNPII